MSVEFSIVIPARYASQRLPGKPLRDIDGRPMIEWVCRAATASGAAEVIVATDDRRIVDAVEAFGGRALMTDSAHPSGTDRIVEVVALQIHDHAVIVPLQLVDDFDNSIGAAGVRAVGHQRTPAESLDRIDDSRVVGGNDHFRRA